MIKKIIEDVIKSQREHAKQSILAFAETYFPHYLKFKTSKEQRHIYKLLEAASKERGKKIAFAAPRGSGKSTLITQIYVLYSVCYSLEKYIMIISNTASQSIQILNNVKQELKENELLRRAFPEVCNAGETARFIHWQKDSIITGNKIMVIALGAEQGIRGRRMGANRPTLVVVDDLENSESTFSRGSREKMKGIFENSILMSGSEITNYLIIGNLFHPHCLLSDYVCEKKTNQWIHECYSAIMKMPTADKLWDEWSQIYNSNREFEGSGGPDVALKYYQLHETEMNEGALLFWPERYSLYDMMVMREENPISFQNELQNQPIDPTLVFFNTDEFRHWNVSHKSVEELLRWIGSSLELYGFCDPALGRYAMKGDYSAIIVLAYDRAHNVIYVIEADIKRCRPDELIDDILAYCRPYKFVRFGVEANGFQEFVIDQLQKKADEAGIRIVFDKIESKQDKLVKIQALRFWFKGGGLQFCSSQRELLEEARYFPKGKHVDGLDALAMAVNLITSTGQSDIKQQSEILKKVSSSINRKGWKNITVAGRGVIDNSEGLFNIK